MAEDQQERQTDLLSAYAAEGTSSTSLTDRDQEIRELRQQVQDLTGVLEANSLTQRQLPEHETRSDWCSQHWTTRNYRGFLGRIWIAGLLLPVIPLESGIFQNLPRFLDSLQTICCGGRPF